MIENNEDFQEVYQVYLFTDSCNNLSLRMSMRVQTVIEQTA